MNNPSKVQKVIVLKKIEVAALRKSNSGNYVQKKKKLISVDSDGNLLKKYTGNLKSRIPT